MKRQNSLPREEVTLQGELNCCHHRNGLRPGSIADANYESANFMAHQFGELKVEAKSLSVV